MVTFTRLPNALDLGAAHRVPVRRPPSCVHGMLLTRSEAFLLPLNTPTPLQTPSCLGSECFYLPQPTGVNKPDVFYQVTEAPTQ